VLDVWEGEPDIDVALLQRVNLGTAHIAGYSLDGKLRATQMLSAAVTTHFQLPSPPAGEFAAEGAALPQCGTWSSADLIRHFVQHSYDIHLDDALLRHAILEETPALERGIRFDHLRKSYRNRRELAGSRLLEPAQPGHAALVRALGCHFDTTARSA